MATGRLPDAPAPPDAHLHHHAPQGIPGRAAEAAGGGRHQAQGTPALLLFVRTAQPQRAAVAQRYDSHHPRHLDRVEEAPSLASGLAEGTRGLSALSKT